jgi:hypothetical protein
MKNPLKKFFKPKLKLVRGTRFVSFLFIAFSVIIAAGFLFAANMYYNIDTGEVVMEEVNRVTGLVKAVGGLVVGQDKTLPSGVAFEVATTSDVLLSGVIMLDLKHQPQQLQLKPIFFPSTVQILQVLIMF